MRKRLKNKSYKGTLRLYISWPVILSLLLAAGTILIFYIDHTAGITAAVVTAVYIVIALSVRFFNRNKIVGDMVN